MLSFEFTSIEGKKFPSFFLHCLDFLDVGYNLDFKKINEDWIINGGEIETVSTLRIYNMGTEQLGPY